MKYVVYFDLEDASEHKIHSTSCWYFINRKTDAKTTRWSCEKYATVEEAARQTNVTRRHDTGNNRCL